MRNLIESRINMQYLKHLLKTNRAYFVIFTILFFISFPSSLILTLLRGEQLYHSFPYETVSYLMIFLTAVAFFFMPYIINGYLNSKKAIDVYHALPIKRINLYMTNALACFIIIFVPFTINTIIGNTIFLMNNVELNMTFLLVNYLLQAVLFIAIQTCSHLVIMNTGTLINGLIHGFILFLAPFIAYGSIGYFSQQFVFGLDFPDEIILSYLSPSYALIRTTYDTTIKQLGLLIVFWSIVILIFTVFILNIYVKRKSERSEEPFTNRKYFPYVTSLFTGLTLIGLMSIFSMNISSEEPLRKFLTLDTFIIPIGFTFVMYVILDFFRFKSAKNFLKSTIQYFIIAATTISLALVMIITGVFGYAYFVPSSTLTNKVSVTLYPSISIFTSASSLYYETTLTLIDDKSIDEFNTFQRLLFDFFEDNSIEQVNNGNFTFDEHLPITLPNNTHNGEIGIQFTLVGGFKINKRYNIPLALSAHLYTLLDNFDVQKSLNPILDMEIWPKDDFTISAYNSNMTDVSVIKFSRELQAKLIENYQKDLESINAETLAFGTSEMKYILSYNAPLNNENYYNTSPNNALFIDSRFTNTISFLESIPDISAMHQTSLSFALVDLNYDANQSINGLAHLSRDFYKEFIYSTSKYRELTNVEVEQLLTSINGSRLSEERTLTLIAYTDSVAFFLPTNLTSFPATD